MKLICGLAVLASAATLSSAANLVLNGDFEDNTAGSTQFNLSNAAYTGFMANSQGFGTSEELDIVTGGDFGISPQSGKWKVGMHQRTDNPANVDAFSLALSGPVSTGSALSLSFYTAGLGGAGMAPVHIGLSSDPGSFGTEIFSGAPLTDTAWTHYTHDFVSPVDALYLTVQVDLAAGNYAFVDNFNLVPAPGSAALAGLGLLAGLRRRRA